MMENDRMFRTMGVVMSPGIEPDEVLRPDGKELCNYLRTLRMELAVANGIEYQPRKCTHNGPCAGTCPQCDEEIQFLNEELSKIPQNQRVYPTVQKYETDRKINIPDFLCKKNKK